jgi:hypothetical protein
MIKTVKDVNLKGKRIVMRVDFYVPRRTGSSRTTPASWQASHHQVYPRQGPAPRPD